MKPGFSKNNKKKKNKKSKKASKVRGNGDANMQDAAPGSPVDMTDAGRAVSTPELVTAKDKQRQRMELKKALKVRVASLKGSRNKLTKLAGSKSEGKKYGNQLQGLLQDQLLSKGGEKLLQTTATDTMAE